jgi:PadR family transcriptional regulator, regulatory protein AphA
MGDVQVTAFEQILLGLICLEPSSGYDLKQRFAASPLGVYQPSSGALYPALLRLARKGLVRARSVDDRDGHQARPRHVYEPTERGVAAHLSWLRMPVSPDTVARDLGLHLMRFVMMEHKLPPDQVLGFLRDLAAALAAFTAGLERHAAATDPASGHAPLALDHGLAVYRASLAWTERTIAALSAAPPRTA